MSFFGLATLSGDVTLDSEGQLQHRPQRAAHPRVRRLRPPRRLRHPGHLAVPRHGADIGTYRFELSGSASVSVRAFGISLGGIDVGFRFVLDTKDGNADGEVPIRLTVRVEVDFGLFSIGGDATFTVGYLRIPKPISSAATAPTATAGGTAAS